MTHQGSLFDWPGLSSLKGRLPSILTYERGVWGKAHGVATDYRWLARSRSFFGHDRELVRDLLLGLEDAPQKSTYWRALPYGHFAVGLYPSRARDAANRGDFAEKQILALALSPEIPAALGALVLLPHAAELQDEVWWSQRKNQPWKDRDFYLQLSEGDHPPIEIHQEKLEATIDAGCRTLEKWGEEILAVVYSRLLAGDSAWLMQSPSPLPPESLAVLLLPLGEELGAKVSLASWVPSSRAELDQLRRLWTVGVRPDHLLLSKKRTVEPPPSEEARQMARALLERNPTSLVDDRRTAEPDIEQSAEDPTATESPVFISTQPRPKASAPQEEVLFEPSPPLPQVNLFANWKPTEADLQKRELQLPLEEPTDRAPKTLQELFAFARNANRRWVEPGELPCLDAPLTDEDAAILKSWIHFLDQYIPPYQTDIEEAALFEHWEVKIDMLRSAALICYPRDSTYREIGQLKSGRIPPLFFLDLRKERSWKRLRGLGDDNLQRLIDQSRSSKYRSPAVRRLVHVSLQSLEDFIRKTPTFG